MLSYPEKIFSVNQIVKKQVFSKVLTMSKQTKETISDKCKRLEQELKKLSNENLRLEEQNIRLRKQKLKLDKENIDFKEKQAKFMSEKIDYMKLLKDVNEEDSRV